MWKVKAALKETILSSAIGHYLIEQNIGRKSAENMAFCWKFLSLENFSISCLAKYFQRFQQRWEDWTVDVHVKGIKFTEIPTLKAK